MEGWFFVAGMVSVAAAGLLVALVVCWCRWVARVNDAVRTVNSDWNGNSALHTKFIDTVKVDEFRGLRSEVNALKAARE